MIGVFLTGDQLAIQTLQRTAAMLASPINVLRGADQILLDDVRNHFEQSGPGWPPLAIQRQVMSRSPQAFAPGETLVISGRKPLIKTGNLMMGFAQHVSMTGNSLERLNLVDYAAVQEFGSDIKNIPARSFAWLSDDAQDKIEQLQLNEIDRVIR